MKELTEKNAIQAEQILKLQGEIQKLGESKSVSVDEHMSLVGHLESKLKQQKEKISEKDSEIKKLVED